MHRSIENVSIVKHRMKFTSFLSSLLVMRRHSNILYITLLVLHVRGICSNKNNNTK